MSEPRATAIYVVYRTAELDLRWIPDFEHVVVVHNDRSLDPARCVHPNVRHVFSAENVGFGAGVNAALPEVRTPRLVLVNPDTVLEPVHWEALATVPPVEVRTVPLLDSTGVPTSVVNRYPTPSSLALTAWRVGRLFPRGSAARNVLPKALGAWGQSHRDLTEKPVGCRPLREYWVSGAVLAVATDPVRAVGGFDENYFLYLEDADLCRRMATRFPDMQVCVADVQPGVHSVGGSADDRSSARDVDRHYARSCHRWARREPGARWRAASAATALRERWLAR